MARDSWLTLDPLARFEDAALLAVRALTGGFLVHGVWDNVSDGARMAEFVAFVRANGFVAPEILAPFSVYTQFAAGILLIAGLLTRWAALLIAATFIVALWMVHWGQSFRECWPALALVGVGLLLAATGAGRASADALLEKR